MNHIRSLTLALLIALVPTCPLTAQSRYTVTDLGTLGGADSQASGINNSGQVVGLSYISGDANQHAFRTAPNCPINPATDDLGGFGNQFFSQARGINNGGQVVGLASTGDAFFFFPAHAFRTASNSPINSATDDLGTFGGTDSQAYSINSSGQVVGSATTPGETGNHAFRTAPNSPINPATDDLGTLGGSLSVAYGINDSGQVVGAARKANEPHFVLHAFRKAPNSPINPATDELGALGGTQSVAYDINNSGEVVGYAYTTGDATEHAFRTASNSPINPATDDLGTLGGTTSRAFSINSSGQVVGRASTPDDADSHGFLYQNGVMYDLNDLVPAGSGWDLGEALSINDAGQIVGWGLLSGFQYPHAYRLDPVDVAVSILEMQVISLGLPHGTQASLISKLQGAIAAIQISDFSTAIGDLQALIHEVNALTGKKITAFGAAALIAAANTIIAAL